MNSIDQYYALAQKELAQLGAKLTAEAEEMAKCIEKDPMERALPCGLSDYQGQLATVQRLMTRYQLLCEMQVANVSQHYADHSVTLQPFHNGSPIHIRPKK